MTDERRESSAGGDEGGSRGRNGHYRPAELYEERQREQLSERNAHHRVAERLSWTRLVLFGGLVAFAWTDLALPAVLAGVAFLGLVYLHGKATRRVRWLDSLASVSEAATHRARRAWHALPGAEWDRVPAEHAYAADIDLHGAVSVVQLLPSVSRAPARRILQGWLLEAAEPPEIRARQRAVAELTPQIDLRDALTALGRRIWIGPAAQMQLESWARGEPWLRHRFTLTALSVALPALTVGLGLAGAFDLVASTLWLMPLTVAAAVSVVYARALRRVLDPVADKSDALQGYAEMTRYVSEASFKAPLLRDAQAEIARGKRPAHVALASLRRLADCSQVRSSPMLHVVLQWLLLWDVHVARLVERWQRRHGQHLAAWLDGLGRFESLAALAGVAHGNPGWTFPDVSESATTLDAAALGHPLLSDDVRVTNDVTVGPPGTFLLVTGSNMSGKSTLLRAIGVNVVLAGAGAPVCAARLRLPPVMLYTSMRITDSLERGVSYFMAEVLRLKQIIDAARSANGTRRPLLYLFDEILQGTNADERTIAAQRIVEFLLTADAIGALATHDLRLLESPAVANAATLVHFREEVAEADDGPALRFDYRLRSGPASSTNALKLMELAGLPVSATQDAFRIRST